MSQEERNEKVIHISGLKKSFDSNHVIRDLELDLHKGENLVVLGKSGAGKSVLIKCIIGLMKPDSGSIQVFGQEVTKMKHDDLDKMRIKIGFLFQSSALYDSMSVRENIEFPIKRNGMMTKEKKNINSLVTEVLKNVGLAEKIDLMPEELSGGMQKRVALARTLILKPEIILYDEPTTGLDPITGREICQLILDVQKKYDTSSIIITHDMECVKITANRIVLLLNGKCYAMGTYDELQKSDDKEIKQFFQ